MMKNSRVRLALAVLLLASFAGTLMAQSYPSRPVRLIVPYPPGGASDLHARHLTAGGIQHNLGGAVILL